MNVQTIKVDDLVPYVRNQKKHDKKQIDNVAESIKQFGIVQPIVVDKDNNIIIGHCRLLACKKLKIKEIPVVKLEDLSPEEANKLRLLDNKLNESDWDFELLAEDIPELDWEGFDIDWNLPELKTKEEIEIVEDEVPENVKAVAKLGDLFEVGKHRLICGDSTDVNVIDKLINGAKADMVFTDPPYGMKKQKDGVLNDNLNYDDLLEFNRQWIPLTFDALKDNGSWYCWGIDEPLMDIYSNILKPMKNKNEISIQNYITWDKGNGFGQMSNLQRSYSIATEKCWFVIRGVQGYNNNSDNYFEGWEPIRKYLEEECEKCGGHNIWKDMLGNNMGHHYFTKSQWTFPTKEAYEKMQNYGNGHNAFKKDYDAFKKDYDAIKKDYDAIKKDYDAIKKEWYETRAYFDNTHDNMNDVWHFNRTSKGERKYTGGHATPKPIALCARAIKSSSREEESVLDIFGGSGSTLIACEQLNRKCYMCELDPHYCDVIINRYMNLTGKDDVYLINEDGTKAKYKDIKTSKN